jgi:hypothetical protein
LKFGVQPVKFQCGSKCGKSCHYFSKIGGASKTLKENNRYVVWTGLDSIIIIGVFNRNCVVDIGTVRKMVNFDRSMMSKHRV